jgi:PAS domain S-box-containing protein
MKPDKMKTEDLLKVYPENQSVKDELFRLAEIVKHSQDAIIGADLEGVIFSWNAGAERIYGRTVEEIEGQHFLTLIPPDRRTELKAILEEISRGRPVESFETRRIRNDGTVIHLSTTISPGRDAEGRITGASLVTRDITKIKEAEETLVQERTLLQIVLDKLVDRVYAKDAAGRYILDNPAHRQFLGVTAAEDVIGRTVFDFFPTEIALQYHADDIEIIRSGKTLLDREEFAFTRSGEKRWMSTTKVPFLNSRGEIAGLVCLSRDISERGQA